MEPGEDREVLVPQDGEVAPPPPKRGRGRPPGSGWRQRERAERIARGELDPEQEAGEYGNWPLPPDGLTPGEQVQLDQALASISVMITKALFHYRQEGHYSTFTTHIAVREGSLDLAGGIQCEGEAWEESYADQALGLLISQRVPATEEALTATFTGGDLPLIATQQQWEGGVIGVFADASAVMARTVPEWTVLTRPRTGGAPTDGEGDGDRDREEERHGDGGPG